LGFFAGTALNGPDTDPPATWQFEEAYGFAKLETRPEDPYSVNLAYVQINGHLYVYAGNTQTNWVDHIAENPLARIRVEETNYPVRAVRVHDKDELARFAEQWSSRSVFQRDPLQFDEVWLFRLETRRASTDG
jgi:hypothetical protein